MNAWSNVKKLLLLCAFSSLLFLPPLYRGAATCFSLFLYPVIASTNAVARSYGAWRERRKSYQQLCAYTEKVTRERDEVRQENTMLKAKLHDFGLTHELRAFQQRYQLDNAVCARIIAKTFTTNAQCILVDKGSSCGVEKDMVALYGAHLVGKVVQVFPWYSKIQLITDSRSRVSGYTFTSQQHGIVQGTNDEGCMELSYVTRVASLATGDHILSSGEGLVFPAGFLLGKITTHYKQELYHHIELEPLIDLGKLQSCLIVARGDVETTSQ